MLLPLGLRKLCDAFNIDNQKGYFPFGLTDINYSGHVPDMKYWPNITPEDYKIIYNGYSRVGGTGVLEMNLFDIVN